MGDLDSAGSLYQEAYSLNPQSPVALDGLAGMCIRRGRLDDARAMVGFLERPGAGQQHPLGRLHELAHAYQKAGRHEEALALAGHLHRESPALGEHRDFRKFVRKSEVATGSLESILPSDNKWRALFNFHSPRYSSAAAWAFFLGIAAVLAAAGHACP